MNTQHPRQDMIDDQASQWIVRIAARPLLPEEQQRLDRWLAADHAHQSAFNEARQAWALMGSVAVERPHSNPVAVKLYRNRWGAVAAGMLVVILGAFLSVEPARVALLADYQTGKGERQMIQLSDGSRVDLGPDSAISLQYDDQERRIRLLSGVAHFDVVPKSGLEHRPFIVDSGEGQIRALGTAFIVQQLANTTQVTVTEHSVEVSVKGSNTPQILGESQQLHFSDHMGSAVNVDLAFVTGWQRGRIIFDQLPLIDAVSILNRYSTKKILITNRALAERRVSGVFSTTNPYDVLDTIATELNLNTTHLLPFVTLLSPAD